MFQKRKASPALTLSPFLPVENVLQNPLDTGVCFFVLGLSRACGSWGLFRANPMAEWSNQVIYRAVLDSLPVAVCAVNRDGKVILWNEGAERVTGYLRQDVLGRKCTEPFLEHADGQNTPLEGNSVPLLETMRTGSCLNVRASLRRKSGQSVGVHLRTVPLRGDDGRLQGAAELFEEFIKRTPEERRHNKLAALGCLDQLTGVLNHSMIQAHLQEALNLYNHLAIEGHTDSKLYPPAATYTNWESSPRIARMLRVA